MSKPANNLIKFLTPDTVLDKYNSIISRINSLEKAMERLDSFDKNLERLNSQNLSLSNSEVNIPEEEAFENIYSQWGLLKSTAKLSKEEKFKYYLYFQYREKSEIAMTVASSWYGGDYFEFGSHDLYTFRNMLSSFYVSGLEKTYPDTQFYGFDIFGKIDPKSDAAHKAIKETDIYFSQFTHQGDIYQDYKNKLKDHNILVDNCHLIQGFFQDSFPEFRKEYLENKGKGIGFALIDVNRPSQYTFVFDCIFDLMNRESYIYLDEYFQKHEVIILFEKFSKELLEKREIKTTYMRNCAGFGALFRLSPVY